MAKPEANSNARRRTGVRSWTHAQDRIAQVVITTGGIGVIAAVLAIGVYLAAIAIPLFFGASVKPEPGRSGITEKSSAPTRAFWTDEYRRSMAILDQVGELRLVDLATGKMVDRRSVIEPGKTATAWSWTAENGLLAIGYSDGSFQIGSVVFESELLTADEVQAKQMAVAVGGTAIWPADPRPEDADEAAKNRLAGWGGVLEGVSATQYRLIRPVVNLAAPVMAEDVSGAITAINYTQGGSDDLVVTLRTGGVMHFDRASTTRPLGGGPPKVTLDGLSIAYQPPRDRGEPLAIYATSDASHVFVLWNDGFCQRYAVNEPRDAGAPLAESVSLLEPGRKVTTSALLLGGITLLVGDDAGMVSAAFAARLPGVDTPDNYTLRVAHRLQAFDAPVTSLGLSLRNRMIAIGDAQGRVAVRSVSSDKDIADLDDAPETGSGANGPSSIVGASITRKDGVVALAADGSYRSWAMDPGHPDASTHALFGKVQYEGSPIPEYVYQSSAANDSAEVKYSLMPLIHGTLKATFFAMLFAAPMAVGAAIYTSEFMHPSWRNRVKPTIEMMASLPSVVLGFVAAMIIAPAMRDLVPALLAGLVVVPIAILLGAHLWQLVPGPVLARLTGTRRLLLVTLSLLVGLAASLAAGSVMESALFQPTSEDRLVAGGSFREVPRDRWPEWVGSRKIMSPDEDRRLRAQGFYFRDGMIVEAADPATPEIAHQVEQAVQAQELDRGSLRRWLDGGIGGPFPGWLIVVFPFAAVAVWLIQIGPIKQRSEAWLAGFSPFMAGLLRLGRLVLSIGAALGIAAVFAILLSSAGLDARDFVLGSFNQRNSLVVGLVMGFAIIPIIYTISEDAMSSVPASLRTASLGAGATPWQTATRVVLPVAASGVFSALMIGLGRAVGETMIVVMATGNTPSMDWSMFSGFRTLSANIAVELPEAQAGETHYRVLFLCGLVLFAMTFLINTTAELVRQRVRRRIASL